MIRAAKLFRMLLLVLPRRREILALNVTTLGRIFFAEWGNAGQMAPDRLFLTRARFVAL